MRSENSPLLLELWLPADAQAVPGARHKAMQACTEAGLTEDDCFNLDLALGEALANAVMHGAPLSSENKTPSQVLLSLWAFEIALSYKSATTGRDSTRLRRRIRCRMPPGKQHMDAGCR